jgi:hypothetical protein
MAGTNKETKQLFNIANFNFERKAILPVNLG